MDEQKKKELIATAVGAASMAWSEVPTGVFDSAKANEICEELYNDLFESESGAMAD